MSAKAERRIARLAAIARDSLGLCPNLAAQQAWCDGVPFTWLVVA